MNFTMKNDIRYKWRCKMSSKKKLNILILALAVIMSSASCSSKVKISANNTDAEKTPAEEKKYKIATTTDLAPFEFQNDFGEYVGIDIDLLKAIAIDQGFTYKLVPMTFNEILEALTNGEVDGAMAGIIITEERKKRYDFSEPYFDIGMDLATKSSRHDINRFEDLKHKTVAVLRGSQAEIFAESMKDQYGFRVEVFDEIGDVYRDVLKGNSSALFDDYPTLGYYSSQGLDIKKVTDIVGEYQYGFAVPKGESAELLEKFNKGLENMKKNGEYQKILDTYIQD